jgi:alpha-galactosidase
MVTSSKKPPVQHERIFSVERKRDLPGKFSRPIKIVFFGAGSIFVSRVLIDILLTGCERGEFVLVGRNPERIRIMSRLAEKLVEQYRRPGWKIVSSIARREVLRGADYVINCIEVSGVSYIDAENDIPAKYGIDQCIGDTIGPGGVFKALRSVPTWTEILRDIEELCPEALVLNYSNPMSIFCLAAARTSRLKVVGLCHSVQATSALLARRAGLSFDQIVWECAGINHLAWFTKFEHQGQDLYPILKEKARRDLERQPDDPDDAGDLIRKDMMLHFGYFITESSGHLSEYVPYYRKRKDLIDRYCCAGFDGESRFLANNWWFWRKNADRQRQEILDGTRPIEFEQSWEYASWIIEAREKNVPYVIHGNVPNAVDGAGPLISNLLTDGIVETACLVDGNGVRALRYGKLPAQCAALCDANMRVIDLAATACIEKSKEAAYHAILLDPLTAAVCSPAEIKQMVMEMFEAEREILHDFH